MEISLKYSEAQAEGSLCAPEPELSLHQERQAALVRMNSCHRPDHTSHLNRFTSTIYRAVEKS